MSFDFLKSALKIDARTARVIVFAVAITIAPVSAIADPLVIKVPAWSRLSSHTGQANISLSQALLMARDAREKNPNIGSIIIELSPGVHRLVRPVQMTARDSGTADNPLIIRSAPGAIVRVIGSRAVFASDSHLLSESYKTYWDSLPAIARSKVRIVNLNQNELTPGEPRRLTFQQRVAPVDVVQKSRPLIMARWPNTGFERSHNITAAASKQMGPQFGVPPDKAAAWKRESNLWAGGYFEWDWFFENSPVSDVDAERGLVTLYPLKAEDPVLPGLRYYIFNALSELDTPGEYVVDWKARRLIIWPKDDDLSANPIEIASTEHLLIMDGSKHVRIEGIAFENSRSDALQIRNSVDIAIEDALVANVGGKGIFVDGGQNVRIVRSVITDTGEAGVVLVGGDRAALTPGNHSVRDSVLVRFSRLGRTYRPGVEIFGVGNSVVGSYFSDAPHTAILFHGNEHRIIGNEITRVVQETSDAGAIYAGRDWTARGTVIAENYIHDIVAMSGTAMDKRAYEVKGVYLDDLLSGITVRRNFFVNVMQPAFIGGGRDNEVSANIFLKPALAAILLDDRGHDWFAKYIVDLESDIRKRLSEVSYQTEPYRSRYPTLPNILEDDPGSPKNNKIGPNIVLGGTHYKWDRSPALARLQQLDVILDEKAIEVEIPPNGQFPRFSMKETGTLATPFDLPFRTMDRKSALGHLKYLGRSNPQ